MLNWIQQNPQLAGALFAAFWVVIPSLAQLGMNAFDKTSYGHAILTVLAGYGINLPQVLDGLKRFMAKALGITIVGALLLLVVSTTGCMVAIPQPGQSPQQVQACTTDATLRNIALGTAGGLTTAAGVEAAVATQESGNQGLSQGLAVAGAITAGVGAVLVGGSALLGQTYVSDGCAPALPVLGRK